jgi:hypothetical protein
MLEDDLTAVDGELVTVRLYDLKIAGQFSRLAGELLLAVELFCDEGLTDDVVMDAARDMRAFCDEHWVVEECP